MRNLVFIFSMFTLTAKAQLSFTERKTDLGIISEAYEIKGDVVVNNTSDKKIFLMRADADKGVKVLASKKTLQSGDSCLLVISFIPEAPGKFSKKIALVTSDIAKPTILEVNGDLKKTLKDDKQACFYFGTRRKSNVKVKDDPIVGTDPKEPRDNSNKMPDSNDPYQPIITFDTLPKKMHGGKQPLDEDPNELSLLQYRPNNIIFLVDVSGSMRDSLKLPLMKEALYTLIDAMRDVDRITIMTYADSVKVLKEGISGTNKKEMNAVISAISPKGYTKGRKAILMSRVIADKHFIEGGNNQVFLATDGIFYFYDKDKADWAKKNVEKKVIISTVAFGDDKEALKNLKEIAASGEGSYIRIKKKDQKELLLEEVKLRCKR
jgi:Mg-chelatase subunit ChlD